MVRLKGAGQLNYLPSIETRKIQPKLGRVGVLIQHGWQLSENLGYQKLHLLLRL